MKIEVGGGVISMLGDSRPLMELYHGAARQAVEAEQHGFDFITVGEHRYWGAIAQKTGLRDDVLENFGIEIRHLCRVLQKPSQKRRLLLLTFAKREPLKSRMP